MSREIVRIALTHAALNDIPVCAFGIQNAYLQAPSSEKYHIIYGLDIRLENVGKHAIKVLGLCGGESARADYWRHARSAIEEMVFSSFKADSNV